MGTYITPAEKGVSGYHKSAGQRDILRQVKMDAQEGLFDVLLVFMFDRLGRREDETPFVVEWFVEQGIEVWSVKEGQQRFDNRVDKLLNYIRFWQSGGESEKNSIRVKEKHKQMVREGKYRGGSPPYGYKLVESGNKSRKGYSVKKLVADEKESLIVKRIFELAVDQGWGGHRIAKRLNEEKIYTKHGNYWTADTVMRLLKNPIYKGRYVSGRRQNSRGEKKRVPSGQWIYSNEIIPELIIIDEAVWNKAEEIRLSRRDQTGRYPKQTKGPLLLVGLLKCGSCGSVMSSRYGVTKWTRKSDNKEVRYLQPKYICQRRSTKIICEGQGSYSQSKVDPAVLEEVCNILGCLKTVDLSEEIIKAKNNAVQSCEDQLREINESISNAVKAIEVLNNEIIKCLSGKSDFTSGQLSAVIEAKRAELEDMKSKKTEIRLRLQDFRNEAANLYGLKNMTPSWGEEFKKAPADIQKMLLFMMIDCIYINKEQININLLLNFFTK